MTTRAQTATRSIGWCASHALVMLGLCATGPVLATPIFADSFDDTCGAVLFTEPFPGADGTSWPPAWFVSGGVALADLQSGRSRLRPTASGYSLARMAAAVPTRNVDVVFTLRLESEPTQGVGFYVRQNGGHLNTTIPAGQGYAVFVEGSFRGQAGVGVWKEENGNEIQLAHSMGVAGPLVATDYRTRLRVRQINPTTTRLEARFWRSDLAEPGIWQVSFDDTTPVLQNLTGGIAIDSWSVLQAPNPISTHTFVDDISIINLCE